VYIATTKEVIMSGHREEWRSLGHNNKSSREHLWIQDAFFFLRIIPFFFNSLGGVTTVNNTTNVYLTNYVTL